MRNALRALSLIVVAAAAGYLAATQAGTHNSTPSETAYQRVLRTGELRCAYGLWEPALMRDPNTGQMSGIVYDIMQELGKALNLKVSFDLEVDWSQIHTTLQSGKADAHCAGVWATPARGRQMAFSYPLSFLPAVAFVRADDTRFDHNPGRIDQPDVTVAVVDDDVSSEIASRDFPNAKTISRPQLGPVEELLLMVKEGKADITFDGAGRLKGFSASHPGAVKIVPLDRPLRIFPNTIAVEIHEDALLHMLDTAIAQLHDNGTVARLIAKYTADYPTNFLVPVSRPYRWENTQ